MSQDGLPAPDARPKGAPDLRWSGLTHTGRFRPNNEDAFLALTFDGHEVRYLGKTGQTSLEAADFVFAVSDGMGGARSGEFASRIAVDRITRLLPRSFRLSAAGMASGFTDVLLELFGSIHADLLELGSSYAECAGMGATLSLCWFRPEWMYFAHVGDSRIYFLPKGGGMAQITHDHTHVGWLRRKGELNEREARTHPRRNALQQALGAGTQFVEPQVGAVAHARGDRFLICSDGLVDGLWDRQIEEIIRTTAVEPGAPTVAQRLIDEAVTSSGRDNTTAVVIEVPAVMTSLFVYGTLKRGGANHRFLAGQAFVGTAHTKPGFTLYALEGYPGMVREPADRHGVSGEVWSVDAACLAELDLLEGTAEGLYGRAAVPIDGPLGGKRVEGYLYLRSVEGRAHLGGAWAG
ncbi:MAG TPA: gamma-glutamylcyclotransferase [Opitutaceae bacterium]